MSHRVRLLCAALLLLGFYAVVGVTVLVWAVLVVATVWSVSSPAPGVFPAPGILFCAGTGPLVYALLEAARRSLFLTEDGDASGTAAGPDEAPALRALVGELTERFRIREPVHLRLTPQASAEMADEDTRYLGLTDGNRVLSLGLPLLAVLSRDQVRAVVAHELAHLALRHHRVRAFTHRLELSLTVARDFLERFGGANGLVAAYVGLPRLLTGAYVRLFRWIVQPVRRRQELEADAAAAEVCDAPQLAEALVRQAMAGQLWPRFQQVFLETAPGGVLPTDPFRSFALAVSDPGVRDRLPHLRADVVTGPTVRTELGASHPDLAERLRNLLQDAPLPAEPSFRPDAALLPVLPSGDVARLLPLYADSRKATLPWEEWIRRWVDRHDAHLAGSLLAAVRALSPQGRRITLRHVLLMLDAGERMTLARAVGKRLPEAEGDPDPLGLLARALLALVSSGLGEHTGSQAELRALVRETVREPGRSSGLTLFLAELGMDEDEPLDSREDSSFTMRNLPDKAPEKGRELISALRRVTLTVLVAGVAAGGYYAQTGPAPGSGVERHSGTGYGSGTGTGPSPSAGPLGVPGLPGGMPTDPFADPLGRRYVPVVPPVPVPTMRFPAPATR
ncbi:M48 family metalloprotease [[Kitasatospora] papulosa]|uniref:M48 family metallopeptidase n=1 Tax=Streptomyces TaxID=1883 RepID=UPI0023B07850|nr:M48 family metallopeptidase [Streptomyces sp. KA12]MDF0372431.1 M48 family metalloprotease [Streptomyces sp. KA12]